MSFRRVAWVTAVLLAALFSKRSGAAQDLMLPKDCEAGFRRFMQMAQNGQLGDDVTNANVGISKTSVTVELIRREAPSKLLFLKPKSATQSLSRYFNVEAGEGATPSDVALVGRALDTVFGEDPFQLRLDLLNTSPDDIPGVVEAWGYGGWRGAVRTLERRMVALAGFSYSIVVIVLLAAGLLASLFVLWWSKPPESSAVP